MQQLTRLRSLLVAGGDDSVYNEEDRQIIEEIHIAETGQKVRECGCRDRYADAVLVLYSKLKRLKTMAKDRNTSSDPESSSGWALRRTHATT